jgi:hypothetical protein
VVVVPIEDILNNVRDNIRIVLWFDVCSIPKLGDHVTTLEEAAELGNEGRVAEALPNFTTGAVSNLVAEGALVEVLVFT